MFQESGRTVIAIGCVNRTTEKLQPEKRVDLITSSLLQDRVVESEDFLGFRLRLHPINCSSSKNRLRLPTFFKTDSDSSNFEKMTPTPAENMRLHELRLHNPAAQPNLLPLVRTISSLEFSLSGLDIIKLHYLPDNKGRMMHKARKKSRVTRCRPSKGRRGNPDVALKKEGSIEQFCWKKKCNVHVVIK